MTPIAEKTAGAMPPVLSDEDLAFWDQNGYVVAKSVISPEQAARTAPSLPCLGAARIMLCLRFYSRSKSN